MRPLTHSEEIKLERGETADDVILCTASQTAPSFNYNFNEGLYRAAEPTRGPQKIKREPGKSILPRSQQQEEKPYRLGNFSAKFSIFKSKHSASQLQKTHSPLTKVRGMTPASEE